MLTPLHKHVLLSGYLHIESRLNEMEPLLSQGKRPSPLNQYAHYLSPTEAKVVEDYFDRIRSTMVSCLEKHEIPVEVHRVSLPWSLQTSVSFLSIAVDEMGPDRLSSYGKLDEARTTDSNTKLGDEVSRSPSADGEEASKPSPCGATSAALERQ